MAEFYSNSISRKKRRKRKVYGGKEFAILLLDMVTTIAMLLLIVLSAITVISQYISPEKSGVFSVIALGAPIIYLLDIVVMFYWIVRWRWYRASAMIVITIIGLFYLPRYYKFEIDRKYDTSYVERRFTKVMTYNVREGKSEGLVDYIKQNNPDILCMQEITTDHENWSKLAELYKTTLKADNNLGNQILSKYRIIRSGEIKGLSLRNGIWADLRVKNDTIRVVSLHLQSTSIRPEDTQFLEKHEYILDKERESKLRSIVSRLVENNRKRAEQSEIIAKFLEVSPYKTIVCGDFNDVPLSYTYNTIINGLDDTFSKMADGFAYTYNTRYGVLRIDNILLSPAIKVVSYEVDNTVEFSDHYPVISRIKIE